MILAMITFSYELDQKDGEKDMGQIQLQQLYASGILKLKPLIYLFKSSCSLKLTYFRDLTLTVSV